MKKTALIMTAAMMFALAGCGAEKAGSAVKAESTAKADSAEQEDAAEQDTSFNTYSLARFAPDGKTGYIPVGDGECMKIQVEDDLRFAAASPDRKTVVVRYGNYSFYTTDLKQKKKVEFDGSCSSNRIYPTNEGIGFMAYYPDGIHFARYTFEDKGYVEMGLCDTGIVAENTTAMASFGNGEICLLAPDSSEVSRYPVTMENEISFNSVSDDGRNAIWLEKTDDSLIRRLYALEEGGEAQLLGNITVRGFASTHYSKDEKLIMVTSHLVDHLYLKDSTGQWRFVELPGDLKNETGVYETDAGLLHQANAEDVHYIYMRCLEPNRLCAVSPDGTVTELREGVRDFDIVDGRLYYSDMDRNVYVSRLNGTEITEEKQLLQGVDAFAVSPSGNYLYSLYIHGDDESVRSLSVYPLNEENAAETILSENIYADEHLYLDGESESLLYVDDAAHFGESSRRAGTLKIYHADTTETEVAAEDVYIDSFSNGKEELILSEFGASSAGSGKFILRHGDVMYRKRPEGNEDGYRYDWYFYNGSENILMASDLEM